MEEEELKKEIVNILNIYGKEIEEVNRLRDVEPHDNSIYLYLEAQARLEGFALCKNCRKELLDKRSKECDRILEGSFLSKRRKVEVRNG